MDAGYFLDGEIMYRRSNDQMLLRCLNTSEARSIIEEVHSGIYGTHANGLSMARKIMRYGYYWVTMHTDCIDYARKCHKCQIYADKIHVPPSPLHIMTAPWPFSMWGIDVIGAITPKASNGHCFILVAIDYFTKWVEAASYANIKRFTVCKFIKKEIVCRYGLPERIITDDALNLNNKMMTELCAQFKIKHANSVSYRPKMNGAVEAANKNIKRIITKTTETYKDWHEKLPFALYAYRTTVRTSTGATPFSLVYGMEAVLPIEVEIPSLRILRETKLDESEWIQARVDQLNLVEEKRLKAICHGQIYQKRMMKYHDKKVHPREFQEDDIVLKQSCLYIKISVGNGCLIGKGLHHDEFIASVKIVYASVKIVTRDATDNKVEFDKSTHQLLQSIIIQFLHICFQKYAKTIKGNFCIIDPREKRQDIDTTMEHVSIQIIGVWF
ncbi:RING-H2 finger protein ATL43-like [Hibiscus syriacus]|uniref:RING-H2 finger protein ATL43-like n=1 Tax=Hibiscus syriacus TaxID=106335 RepID=A0A6A2WQA0_HIBSY|nr:RING-H2 finger protein ATL43-like [Hibiscus syriacus]